MGELFSKYSELSNIDLRPLNDEHILSHKNAPFMTKYGEVLIRRDSLLKGIVPTVFHAVDKVNYFLNVLEEINPEVRSKIISVEKFNFIAKKVKMNTIYGEIEIAPSRLYKTKDIPIFSALDRESFWLKRIKSQKHRDQTVDYSEFQYSASKNKATFKCLIHSHKYKQRIDKHDLGVQGCPFCVTKIKRYTRENFENHPDFFRGRKGIFYVLNFRDESESFYKVGITNTKKEYRFSDYKKHYQIVQVYEYSGDIEHCYNIEQKVLEVFNLQKYLPK